MAEFTQIIAQCGGQATRRDLFGVMSGAQLTAAVRDGTLLRPRRGIYTLPGLDHAVEAANRLNGVASHRSAALLHGWGVLHAPGRPEVTVPRHRRVTPARRTGVRLHWRPLDHDDVDEVRTTPVRTVLDCAAELDLPEALAVADSALRRGDLTVPDLTAALAALPRLHRRRAARIVTQASEDAANPFESGLRGLAIDATGAIWSPQQTVRLRGGAERHADVGCPELRIALEADSHEFHKTRADVRRDCRRYDEMILAGWLVLRFAWEDVMFDPDWVMEVIAWVVRQRAGMSCGSPLSLPRGLAVPPTISA